jgi:putative protease
VRVYLALNIVPHGNDLARIASYLDELIASSYDEGGGIELLPDAYIVSDPGIISVVRAKIPNAELHLSTQANVTNAAAARFWHDSGVRRIVLARELSLDEIREIREHTPPALELEAFVHGAMCISYSGRCLLSTYMTGRDSNGGECAQPCRWEYNLLEKERPDEIWPIYQDDRGTYVFNSKDLCLIEHLSALKAAGVSSYKIEGRMKSVYYVATVTNAYRAVIDNPLNEAVLQTAKLELQKTSHRLYTQGFLQGNPGDEAQRTHTSSYIRGYLFLGTVMDVDVRKGRVQIQQRGKFTLGDEVELFGPGLRIYLLTVQGIMDEHGTPQKSAPHPMQTLYVTFAEPLLYGDIRPGYMLRFRKSGVKHI